MTNGVEGDRYEAEARERWGHTDAYQESARRTKRDTKDDWAEIHARQDEIEAGFAEAMAAGVPPDGAGATELAEEARLHIDRHFYPCDREMHARLADLYDADGRFQAHYEKRAEGLAAYVAGAIRANRTRTDG